MTTPNLRSVVIAAARRYCHRFRPCFTSTGKIMPKRILANAAAICIFDTGIAFAGANRREFGRSKR
jgi:hypothetical protein